MESKFVQIAHYRSKQKRSIRVRWFILGFLVLGTSLIGFLHQHPLEGFTPPGVDALCPFGALESLPSLISEGLLLKRVAVSSFILLAAAFLVSLLFRRGFCGQVCPLGALQELSAKLGLKLRSGKKLEVNPKIDRPARWIKYFLLAFIVLASWLSSGLIIRPYDPWAAFMHISSAEILSEFAFGLGLLVVSLGASVFYERFFCKYLCPMGAAYGIFSKLGVYRIKRQASTCINCKACDKACPVDLRVSEALEVTSAECLACSSCVNTCPVPDTLAWTGPKNRTLPPIILSLGTLGIFLALILITNLAGAFDFKTKSLKEDLAHTQTVESSQSREFSAETVAQIKGRNTLTEIAETFGISKEVFQDHFALNEEDLSLPIKDLAAKYDSFSTEALRSFVAEILGISDFTNKD